MIRAAWIHFTCPRCEAGGVARVDGEPAHGPALRCFRCGFVFPRSTAEAGGPGPLSRCSVCGGAEFYVQKDFNRGLGLGIVAATAVSAFAVMVVYGHLWGFLVLGAVTLLDLGIYRFLPEVTVCYLCQSVYHGFPQNSEHRGFYLGNEERFKPIRRAWLEGLKG